MEKTETKSE